MSATEERLGVLIRREDLNLVSTPVFKILEIETGEEIACMTVPDRGHNRAVGVRLGDAFVAFIRQAPDIHIVGEYYTEVDCVDMRSNAASPVATG